MTYNTLIVLLGVGMLGAVSGLVGGFAVLRRRALLGDALSHAALPGLCVGFLIAGERSLPAMLLGALASGLLGVGVVSYLQRRTRVREDAAIGIVLSVFFGAGIVLSRLIQNSPAVAGSKAGLDSYILGKTAGMVTADAALIGGVAIATAGLVGMLFKEFLLVSFDPEFARVQGWPARRLDLALTGLIAVAVVVGLPAVGVVLMAALLIIPGVSARFWSDRLARVVALAAALGAGMGLVGTGISAAYEKMPAGPVITLVGTGVFLFSALAAPRRGLIARTLARWGDRWRADYSELLRLLLDADVAGVQVRYGSPQLHGKEAMSPEELARGKSWSPGRLRQLLAAAVREGHVAVEPNGTHRLTTPGRVRAMEAARRYRQWQLVVTEYPDLVPLARPLSDAPVEEVLPADVVAELNARLQKASRRLDESSPSEQPSAGGAR